MIKHMFKKWFNCFDWRVAGYTKAEQYEVSNEKRKQTGYVTARVAVLVNGNDTRKLRIIFDEVNYPYTVCEIDPSLCKAILGLGKYNLILSGLSSRKVNRSLDFNLTEYDQAAYTWDDFKKHFVYGVDSLSKEND